MKNSSVASRNSDATDQQDVLNDAHIGCVLLIRESASFDRVPLSIVVDILSISCRQRDLFLSDVKWHAEVIPAMRHVSKDND